MIGIRNSVWIAIVLTVSGCQVSERNNKKPVKANTTFVSRDTISEKENFLNILGEPDLDKVNVETYRFYYDRMTEEHYLFRIQKDGNNISLTSKCFLDGEPGLVRIYNGRKYAVDKDTVIEETTQKISISDWNHFIETLQGSYYWAISIPCPEGDGFTGGRTLVLESKSATCDTDSLKYHMVSLHVPKKGSFRSACRVLAELSSLTRYNKGILHELE